MNVKFIESGTRQSNLQLQFKNLLFAAAVATTMEDAMEDFVHRENLALLKKRLAENTDPARREIILKLMAEEQARQVKPKDLLEKRI